MPTSPVPGPFVPIGAAMGHTPHRPAPSQCRCNRGRLKRQPEIEAAPAQLLSPVARRHRYALHAPEWQPAMLALVRGHQYQLVVLPARLRIAGRFGPDRLAVHAGWRRLRRRLVAAPPPLPDVLAEDEVEDSTEDHGLHGCDDEKDYEDIAHQGLRHARTRRRLPNLHPRPRGVQSCPGYQDAYSSMRQRPPSGHVETSWLAARRVPR